MAKKQLTFTEIYKIVDDYNKKPSTTGIHIRAKNIYLAHSLEKYGINFIQLNLLMDIMDLGGQTPTYKVDVEKLYDNYKIWVEMMKYIVLYNKLPRRFKQYSEHLGLLRSMAKDMYEDIGWTETRAYFSQF